MKNNLIYLQYIGYVLLIATFIFCLLYKLSGLIFLIDITLAVGFASITSFGLYYILDQINDNE